MDRGRRARKVQVGGAAVNIDQAIKAAQERIHRSVGQRARFEKRWVAELAAYHRRRMAWGSLGVTLPDRGRP